MNVLILFETQTGTTQYVAETVAKELTTAGHTVKLHSLKYDGKQLDFAQYQLVLIGAPTYDDGLLEVTMRQYIRENKPDFRTQKVAVFGLGDSSYPQFCTAARFLETWVKTCGGRPLIPTLKVDGFPDDLSPILAWTRELITTL